MLPSKLVNRLREVSVKKGTSVSGFAADALEEALRAEKAGTTVHDAVEAYEMREIQRGAGAMVVLRSSLSQLVENNVNEKPEELSEIWREAGNWYGHYLAIKMGQIDVFPFLEKELKASWNLDDVEIKVEDDVIFTFICFMMSEKFTELLLSYMVGLMSALGYSRVDGEHTHGMATIKFMKNLKP